MSDLSEPVLPLPAARIERLKATQQNPRYHAEGNVYNHTCLVVEAFEREASQLALSAADQEVLYWACVLHDVAKPEMTRLQEGRWTARGHEKAGVPLARDLLLTRSEVSPAQRDRILRLIRWHNVPLRWGLRRTPLRDYQLLATETDLRLLGLFARFDMLGRICDDQPEILSLIGRYQQQVVPQVAYELGSYQELQDQFRRASLRRQNALWYAWRQQRPKLVEKLIKAEDEPKAARPRFACLLAMGPDLAAQETYLRQHYPAYQLYPAAQDGRSEGERLRHLKNFLSVYAQAGKPVAISGHFYTEATRRPLLELLRQLDGQVTCLHFAQPMTDPGQDAPEFDLLHPWEVHQMEWV
jgi:putative nucleotidyltransferase with HDIG domain